MPPLPKSVSVIGLGYIGLPNAAVLANAGYTVHGCDLNTVAVATINQGRIHIVEPDLETLVQRAILSGRFKAYASPQAADIYLICVPTPFRAGSGLPEPDLDYVIAAVRSIATLIKPGDLLILESTSPVGTTEMLGNLLSSEGVSVDSIHLAYCPERVLPGKIVSELLNNDRVVGGLTPAATEVVSAFYRSFVQGAVLATDATTAEMCKLTENSFRDVNIAFANELSMLCVNAGIDVWKLIQLANRHPRVNILQPGPGVGGHCIAVDPWFIVARDPENAQLIRTAREVNNRKTEWVIERIKIAVADASARSGRKPKVACLGLAFKPDIDDLRESPALQIAEKLHADGYDVIGVEPNVQQCPPIPLVTIEQALSSADVFVVLVKHRQFLHPEVLGRLSERGGLDFCGALLPLAGSV